MAGMKQETPTGRAQRERFSTKLRPQRYSAARREPKFFGRKFAAPVIGETLTADSLGPEAVHLPPLA
jgi:hypothetical protein